MSRIPLSRRRPGTSREVLSQEFDIVHNLLLWTIEVDRHDLEIIRNPNAGPPEELDIVALRVVEVEGQPEAMIERKLDGHPFVLHFAVGCQQFR